MSSVLRAASTIMRVAMATRHSASVESIPNVWSAAAMQIAVSIRPNAFRERALCVIFAAMLVALGRGLPSRWLSLCCLSS